MEEIFIYLQEKKIYTTEAMRIAEIKKRGYSYIGEFEGDIPTGGIPEDQV